jgi:hypothetical protein
MGKEGILLHTQKIGVTKQILPRYVSIGIPYGAWDKCEMRPG